MPPAVFIDLGLETLRHPRRCVFAFGRVTFGAGSAGAGAAADAGLLAFPVGLALHSPFAFSHAASVCRIPLAGSHGS
jgi:hypothetical protein